MPRWANIICIPCLTVGLGLVLFSATAMAADANDGPTWSLIATGLVGMVVALIGAYAKGLERRISGTEQSIAACTANTSALREMVLTQYHNDAEIERLLGPVNLQLADLHKGYQHQQILLLAIHNRLDQAGIGVRPRGLAQDDGA
jgi:hypothetical protein